MGEKLNVGDVCNRIVVFATEEMSLKEAAGLMRDNHVGSLVVVREADAGKIVLGMLTDRDIAIVAVARDFDPQTLRVADVMTTELVTVRPDDSMYDALNLMSRHGIRRIPVTTDDGVLLGIVTFDDLVEIFAEEMQTFAQAITRERKREERIRV